MNKRSDQVGSISWQDAFQVWAETSKEYGVDIQFGAGFCQAGKYGRIFCTSILVKGLGGATAGKVVYRRPLEYPNRHAATFPGTIVYHLSAIALELEKRREPETERVAP